MGVSCMPKLWISWLFHQHPIRWHAWTCNGWSRAERLWMLHFRKNPVAHWYNIPEKESNKSVPLCRIIPELWQACSAASVTKFYSLRNINTKCWVIDPYRVNPMLPQAFWAPVPALTWFASNCSPWNPFVIGANICHHKWHKDWQLFPICNPLTLFL